MKRKGFSLIELLSVIVTLAVIALIALPIILGIVEDAKEKANENSTYGIIDSANYYFANKIAKGENPSIGENILDKITYHGQAPASGSEVYLNEQGQVAVVLSYGTACYKKGYEDTKLKKENLDTCYVVEPAPPLNVTIAEFFPMLSTVTDGSGLYKTEEEYRYRGGTVNNDIMIKNERYRIVALESQGLKVISESTLLSYY